MDKYISQDAAHEAVCGDCEYNATQDCEDCRMNRLTKLPAADVVEVVRCKDCRDYNTTGYDDAPGFGWCECLRREVQDCFYCAHGEREDYQCKE